MANEITLNANLAYEDSEGADETLSIVDKLSNITTKVYQKSKQNIGITEEAIKLGELATLGYAIFINRDSTNFIELRVATAGIKFCKLLPGEAAMFRFGSGISAPFAIADTAPCQLEYMILAI